MSSLTNVAFYSRNIIKYGSIGLISFIILQAGGSAAITAYKKAHPPYVAPTVKYGKLPKIVFPEKTYSTKNFSFEFANDAAPTFGDRSNVYVIYRPVSTLLALEEDTKTANKLGFSSQPTETKTGVYQWSNTITNQTLTISTLNGNFTMAYPYLTDQLLQSSPAFSDKQQAIEEAKNYLSNVDKLDSDLANGEQKASYWKINYNGLTSVSALSEANIIRVDFFREKLGDSLPVVTADPDKASVSVLVSSSTVDTKKIVEVDYNYVSIDRQSFSTYPIKTAAIAMADLKSGNYWPAKDITSSDVIIRKMYLAYFEPTSSTNYLEPIYVFEGDNNFVAYEPAVTDAMVSSTE